MNWLMWDALIKTDTWMERWSDWTRHHGGRTLQALLCFSNFLRGGFVFSDWVSPCEKRHDHQWLLASNIIWELLSLKSQGKNIKERLFKLPWVKCPSLDQSLQQANHHSQEGRTYKKMAVLNGTAWLEEFFSRIVMLLRAGRALEVHYIAFWSPSHLLIPTS